MKLTIIEEQDGKENRFVFQASDNTCRVVLAVTRVLSESEDKKL